jgi:outer membrane protein OmpA-like peptidoglycan-associated protein
VDILVEKTAEGLRILSSRIFFKPYTADYIDVRPDLKEQNMKRLEDMAAKLKKFPNYKIKLIGHAVMIHWDNKVLGDAEQKYVLIPLSQRRAEAIKKAMVDKGLDEAMFTTEGVGASDQIVPDSDLANRWQNRRVAFYVER